MNKFKYEKFLECVKVADGLHFHDWQDKLSTSEKKMVNQFYEVLFETVGEREIIIEENPFNI